MPVMNVAKFERFFRLAASLDVDKGDLRRYNDFIDQKMHDLLLIGQAHAKANDHELIWPSDLPVTKGLQESIHEFRDIDEQIELLPILEGLTRHPPMDLGYNKETQAELPEIAGGMSVALARSFKVIAPGLKNPTHAEWDRHSRCSTCCCRRGLDEVLHQQGESDDRFQYVRLSRRRQDDEPIKWSSPG